MAQNNSASASDPVTQAMLAIEDALNLNLEPEEISAPPDESEAAPASPPEPAASPAGPPAADSPRGPRPVRRDPHPHSGRRSAPRVD